MLSGMGEIKEEEITSNWRQHFLHVQCLICQEIIYDYLNPLFPYYVLTWTATNSKINQNESFENVLWYWQLFLWDMTIYWINNLQIQPHHIKDNPIVWDTYFHCYTCRWSLKIYPVGLYNKPPYSTHQDLIVNSKSAKTKQTNNSVYYNCCSKLQYCVLIASSHINRMLLGH